MADHYAELTIADEKAARLFGEDAFCAIDGSDRREILYRESGNLNDVILLGRGGDFEEAFEIAVPFFERFYVKDGKNG